jgi:hypothetical protein
LAAAVFFFVAADVCCFVVVVVISLASGPAAGVVDVAAAVDPAGAELLKRLNVKMGFAGTPIPNVMTINAIKIKMLSMFKTAPAAGWHETSVVKVVDPAIVLLSPSPQSAKMANVNKTQKSAAQQRPRTVHQARIACDSGCGVVLLGSTKMTKDVAITIAVMIRQATVANNRAATKLPGRSPTYLNCT